MLYKCNFWRCIKIVKELRHFLRRFCDRNADCYMIFCIFTRRFCVKLRLIKALTAFWGEIHAVLTVKEFRCRDFLLSETILWCQVTFPDVRKERLMLWDWSCYVPYRTMRTIHRRCWSFRLNGEREGYIIHPIYMYIKEKEDAYAGLQTEGFPCGR